MKNRIDFFNPLIVVVGILAFLAMGYTLEVFERILPLAGTTHGKILSMIFFIRKPENLYR